MKKIGIYTYGGSGNHGCEALLRTIVSMLEGYQITLYSQRVEDDVKYVNDLNIRIKMATKRRSVADKVLDRIESSRKKIRRKYMPVIKESSNEDIMISIGGDNYCYDDYMQVPGVIREGFSSDTRSILIGCSVEDNVLLHKEVVDDLNAFDLITVREPKTFKLLKDNLCGPRIIYTPDSAFFLEKDYMELPSEGEFVGINISPMVIKNESNVGSVLDNTNELINYILESTNYNIILIPHVVWNGTDDRTVLNALFSKYQTTRRVFLAEDANCMKLKGIISQCKFFIGARTHATIAAYSSCVPTIVLGYSVKSEGIALDLFGTTEHYVLPVHSLGDGELVKDFIWLMDNENEIRKHLQEKMPEYIENAKSVKDDLLKIIMYP